MWVRSEVSLGLAGSNDPKIPAAQPDRFVRPVSALLEWAGHRWLQSVPGNAESDGCVECAGRIAIDLGIHVPPLQVQIMTYDDLSSSPSVGGDGYR